MLTILWWFFIWYVPGFLGSFCIGAIYDRNYDESLLSCFCRMTGWNVVICSIFGLAGIFPFAAGAVALIVTGIIYFTENNETWLQFSEWLSKPIWRK